MGKTINTLLSVNQLSVALDNTEILSHIDFSVEPNEIVALVGESGSGKSVTAQAIMGLLPKSKTVISHGNIRFHGKELPPQSDRAWQNLRGKEIGMIFQEPQSSLNPSMRCGKQVEEMGKLHFDASIDTKERKLKVLKAFEEVQLVDPERVYKSYPHQLSGGQKQRVMIAMALLCKPQLLIADEPTTALDVLVQKDIIRLIKNLQAAHKMSVLFISHDLSLVANLADRILVMKEGEIVEQNTTKTILNSPQHTYTRALLNARPPTDKRLYQLPTLADFKNPDFNLSFISPAKRKETHQSLYTQAPLLRVAQLQKTYLQRKNIFGQKTETKAIKEVSFSLYPGETLGLVGASGCGKSTLAKSLVFLDPPTQGEIFWEEQRINPENLSHIKQLRKNVQFIFQDPYAALHPLKSIGNAIDEVLRIHTKLPKKERKERSNSLLLQVGLDPLYAERYPHQLSGGQRQRVVIARALAVEPQVLLCDESVAALDISVQAQVLNLLNYLKRELNLSYLFISHDLGVVKHMADRILVMHNGAIVEENEADALYEAPQSPYTKKLLKAIV